MNEQPSAAADPGVPPTTNEHARGNAVSQEALANEIASLKQQLQRLEQERESDRQLLATLKAERDEYHRALCRLVWEHRMQPGYPSEQELQQQIQQGNWLPLADFLGDIEQAANGIRSPR